MHEKVEAPLSETDFAHKTYRRISFRLIPLLATCYGVAYIDRVNVSFAALQMNHDLRFSASVYGFGAGLFFLSYAACEIPANLMLLRFGARLWIARIMVSWGLISAAMVLVSKPWEFYVVRLLLGAAEAGFFPGAVYYLTVWFPHEARARAISSFYMAFPISAVLMASSSGFILDLNGHLGLAGWQWMFLIEAAPAVLLGFFVFGYLADGPADAGWLSVEERTWVTHQLESASGKTAAVGHTTLKGALRDTRLWRISFFLIASFTAAYAYGFTAPLLIKEVTGYGNKTVGFIVASVYAFVALAIVGNGLIASRTKSPYLCIAVPATLVVLGCLGVGLFHKPALVICSLALINVFHNASYSPLLALVTSFLTKRAAAGGLALLSGLGILGGFLGPYYMGLAKGFFGSYQRGFFTLSIPTFAGLMLMLQLRKEVTALSHKGSTMASVD